MRFSSAQSYSYRLCTFSTPFVVNVASPARIHCTKGMLSAGLCRSIDRTRGQDYCPLSVALFDLYVVVHNCLSFSECQTALWGKPLPYASARLSISMYLVSAAASVCWRHECIQLLLRTIAKRGILGCLWPGYWGWYSPVAVLAFPSQICAKCISAYSVLLNHAISECSVSSVFWLREGCTSTTQEKNQD